MEKVKLGNQVSTYPMPVVLVGTKVEGTVNFMTVGWVSRVNHKPPLIAVAINNVHHTHRGIKENKTYSINFPSTDMVEVTDYCGIRSGKKMDKSGLFEVFYGETGAPMIKDCPLTIECTLYETVSLPTNALYIGEIVEAYTEEKYLTDGKPDLKKLDPLIMTMPDNKYWTAGEFVDRAWGAGKKYRK